MTVPFRQSFLLLCLVALVGCASSYQPVKTDRSIAAINRALEGRQARILFADGRLVSEAQSVRLTADSLSYTTRAGFQRDEPRAAVKQISYVRDKSGTAWGVAIGALPGVAFVVAGKAGSCSGNPISCEVAGSVVTTMGVGMALAGALLGALIGSASKRRIVVYEGPARR